MTIQENILKIRSHIAFLVGLFIAAGIALSVETGVVTGLRSGGQSLIQISDNQTAIATVRGLSPKEFSHAQTAWKYFQANTQPETGLVNSVHEFPSTTIWDQASYLLALISAQRIGLISVVEFDDRISKVIKTLARLPLFDGKLPNKVYDTRSLKMVNYTNQSVSRGIGWSALDVARITVPLNILLYDYPKHAQGAGTILTNWDFSEMLREGVMYGARVHTETGATEHVQEGRLGYEEYGARAIGLLGLDALAAGKYDDFVRFEKINGARVAVDSRSFAEFDAHNFVVSEPYVLTAVEFGFDRDSRELAHRIYQAQMGRYQATGVLTAVSEDNIDQAPYFLYNTVYANGKAWNALAEDGSEHPDKRTLSTKAAFGWHAIYQSDYTEKLMREVMRTRSTDRGWLSGIYEIDGAVNAVATANTNAIILETLHYKANGPLLSARFGKKGS